MSVRLIFKSVWRNPGNYGHRISRLRRAAAWQLEKHTKRWVEKIRLPNGTFFVAYPDCVISSALIYADWPEFHELQFIRRTLKRGEVIIDVGANVGHISLLLSDIAGPENIIAFEPTPVSFQRLRENWTVNGWATEKLFQKAVGRANGSVRFLNTSSPETKNAVVSAHGDAAVVDVPLVALDECRSIWSGHPIGLLKIDVEGYENEVFAGAVRLLRENRPRLIMFESLPGKLDETIDGILAEVGYQTFQLDDVGRPDFNRATAQNLFAAPMEDTAKLR